MDKAFFEEKKIVSRKVADYKNFIRELKLNHPGVVSDEQMIEHLVPSKTTLPAFYQGLLAIKSSLEKLETVNVLEIAFGDSCRAMLATRDFLRNKLHKKVVYNAYELSINAKELFERSNNVSFRRASVE